MDAALQAVEASRMRMAAEREGNARRKKARKGETMGIIGSFVPLGT
jgi:hypothetical protein